MIFRDKGQAVRVVQAMLALVGLADLWTEEGPTDRARALRQATARRHGRHKPGSAERRARREGSGAELGQEPRQEPGQERGRRKLPDREREAQHVMLLAAWSIWCLWREEPGRCASLKDVCLRAPRYQWPIGDLLIALWAENRGERWKAVDGWVARWGSSSAPAGVPPSAPALTDRDDREPAAP
ncbi:MAG TPA: hypothetical protein VLS89_20705 [Candidatus Nanopelagicales bacterium]|nr:hypothetical protein [Candidatus Nanopelagicales bacterium]